MYKDFPASDRLLKTFTTIAEHIRVATGQPCAALSTRRINGGDINAAFCLEGFAKPYFIKLNRADLLPMFQAEFAGLQAIAATDTVRVPQPLLSGVANGQAYLVLEHIAFGQANRQSWQTLGRQLADLHRQPHAYFGWQRDNTIGSTPQPNHASADWLTFWRDRRLAYQLQLAASNGYRGNLQRLGERLCADLAVFFAGYQPVPSLLHGDLWGGNVAVDRQGVPVIFDPACYYGDRETDLAMTELFGGFAAEFYAAYQAQWPLEEGYAVRKILYNLYHILNHLNLFGGHYLSQAEKMITLLLAELA